MTFVLVLMQTISVYGLQLALLGAWWLSVHLLPRWTPSLLPSSSRQGSGAGCRSRPTLLSCKRAGARRWQWRDLEPGTRPSRAAQYSGWEASQAAIAEALEAQQPIDGLLGEGTWQPVC